MLTHLNSHRRRALALFLLGLMAFAVSIGFPFIALDDAKHIWQNPYVMTLSEQTLKFFWQHDYYGLFIPVVYNAWALLAHLTQSLGLHHEITTIAAPLFHAVNVLLHALNVYLMFHFLTIWVPSQPTHSDAKTHRLNWDWPVFLATMIFAFHPLQVESVVWASGLKDVLSATLMLMSLTLFSELFGRPTLAKAKLKGKKDKSSLPQESDLARLALKSRMLNLTLAYGFFALALLAKPAVVTWPACGLLLIVFRGVPTRGAALKALAPFLLIAIPFVIWTKSAQPDVRLEFHLELWQRPIVALYSLGFYISKFFLPIQLAPDYGLTPVVAWSHWSFWPLVALGATVLGAEVIALRRRSYLLASGLGIFVLGLLPTLGLVPFEFQNMSTVADRYVYLFPMLGLCLAVCAAIHHLPNSLARGVLPLMGLLLAGTVYQSLYWRSNEALFSRTIEVNPRSYLAHGNLGLQALRANNFNLAEAETKMALTIKPDYMAALANLGAVYFKQKNYNKAIEHYLEALHRYPDAGAGSPATIGDMHFNLGASYVNTGKNDLAVLHLRKAVLINPDNFTAHFHLGRLLAALGDRDGAIKSYEQALRLKPQDPGTLAEVKKLGF